MTDQAETVPDVPEDGDPNWRPGYFVVVKYTDHTDRFGPFVKGFADGMAEKFNVSALHVRGFLGATLVPPKGEA